MSWKAQISLSKYLREIMNERIVMQVNAFWSISCSLLSSDTFIISVLACQDTIADSCL